MSNDTPEVPAQSFAPTIDPNAMQAHVERVKLAWRAHERAMTWEQKIQAIERMRIRSAQLARARDLPPI